MGRPDITDVIELLQTAGYRTGRAFPGKRMPAIQVPAVTVAVQKDEEKQQLLAVTVLCPENMGGGQCEDAALGITEVLRQRGYICTQEHCQYDGRGDRFSVRILALWEDAPADDPYAVSMGLGPMNYVDGFSVEQKKDLLPVGTILACQLFVECVVVDTLPNQSRISFQQSATPNMRL